MFFSKSGGEADCRILASHWYRADASCTPLKIISLKDRSYKPPVFVIWQTRLSSVGGIAVVVAMDCVGVQADVSRCRYVWHSSTVSERVKRVFASAIRSST